MNEEKINSIVNKSYYNPNYAKSYYEKNKELIIKRSKERWNNMSDVEKKKYYQKRKNNRRLK